MKTKIIAAGMLIVVLLFAAGNAIAIKRGVGKIEKTVESLGEEDDARAYAGLREDYSRLERLLALTVNHEDLMAIEADMSEFVAAKEAGDAQTLHITKSRLLDALAHLKRLSGFNFDSIL